MLIDLQLLPGFLIAVAAVELTPGPNMGYLAVLSARHGASAGFAAVVGVTLGLAVYMLAAVLGLAEALLLAPGALEALRWAGVAYLLWLAFQGWRGGRETSPGHGTRHIRRWRGRNVWNGFVTNILNPKAAVFYVLLLPGFVREDGVPAALQILALGVIHLAISVVVHAGVVLAAARMGKAATTRLSGARLLLIRRLLALTLVGVAGWLGLESLG